MTSGGRAEDGDNLQVGRGEFKAKRPRPPHARRGAASPPDGRRGVGARIPGRLPLLHVAQFAQFVDFLR